MTSILLIGSGAREHAIAEAVIKSKGKPKLFAFMSSSNPGIQKYSTQTEIGSLTDIDSIRRFAGKINPDICVVGPESPLAAGVVDSLDGQGIPCVGPFKTSARLESSKGFTRELVKKYSIPGNPKMRIFTSMDGVKDWAKELGEFVIKPDGLTGGKGVMVMGDHFSSIEQGVKEVKDLIAKKQVVIIEEKLEGEEFSLQSITDGKHVIDCPPVQDHKRAFEGDTGPNTGGMGSYSAQDHKLPFLSQKDLKQAHDITEKVLVAINKETKTRYKGVMYGGFMATKDGVRLIEYNARFGDPEAMNVLSILESDFVEMCWRIVDGNLKASNAVFAKKATVCKYLVPKGYPDSAKKGTIKVGRITNDARIYYAAVNAVQDELQLSSSRALAVVGIGDTIEIAEKIAQKNMGAVSGPLTYRKDIGTQELIQKRVEHMKKLRGNA